MRGAAAGSQCSALVLSVGLFVAISTRLESEYQCSTSAKQPSCTAMLGAVFPIYGTHLGSQITGCKNEHNDVMEVYGNLITNIECAVRTIYCASVYFNLQYNYVCLLLKNAFMYFLFN